MMEYRSLPDLTAYEFGSDGSVWSLRGRWDSRQRISEHTMQGRYKRVGLQVNGKRRYICVHALICRAFHGERPSTEHMVRHFDGDDCNNGSDNLLWGTALENAADMIRHGRSPRGERNAAAKITWAAAQEIRVDYRRGWTQMDLARRHGISQASVSDLLLGKTWITES